MQQDLFNYSYKRIWTHNYVFFDWYWWLLSDAEEWYEFDDFWLPTLGFETLFSAIQHRKQSVSLKSLCGDKIIFCLHSKEKMI